MTFQVRSNAKKSAKITKNEFRRVLIGCVGRYFEHDKKPNASSGLLNEFLTFEWSSRRGQARSHQIGMGSERVRKVTPLPQRCIYIPNRLSLQRRSPSPPLPWPAEQLAQQLAYMQWVSSEAYPRGEPGGLPPLGYQFQNFFIHVYFFTFFYSQNEVAEIRGEKNKGR